jgi:hypothetical protein
MTFFDNALGQPISALSKDYSFLRLTQRCFPPANRSKVRRWRSESVHVSNISKFEFLLRCNFLHENGASLFLNVLIIWFSCKSGLLIWGIVALHSSRPLDFNKRRKNVFKRYLANKPESVHPFICWNNRISSEKPV